MKKRIRLCAVLLAVSMLAACSNGKTNNDNEEIEDTEVIEQSETEAEELQQTEAPAETAETETQTEAAPAIEDVDLSNLYGRDMVNVNGSIFYQHVYGDPQGREFAPAGEWGVFIFPECIVTVTGYEQQYDELQGFDVSVPVYSLEYPVTDTGSGYEFICTICYPDIVSSEGSLSGRTYTLVSEDWGDGEQTNPHVTCTYADENGNTFTAGNLLSTDEESIIYDENGNAAFVVLENVRLFVSYENAGDLYDAFIAPALDGSIVQADLDLYNCYKVRFSESGVISCFDNEGSPWRGNMWSYTYGDSVEDADALPLLYVVDHDYQYLSENAPDVELTFINAPLTIIE